MCLATVAVTDKILASIGNESHSCDATEIMRSDAVKAAALAKECIGVFGDKSYPLLLLADFVLHRVS